MTYFSDKIKELRLRDELLQKDMAVDLGIDKSTVAGWETDKSYPTVAMLLRLSDYFKVTPNDLLGYATSEHPIFEREHALLSEFRKLDDYQQGQVLGFVKAVHK